MKEISGIFSDKKSLDKAVEKISGYGVLKDHISLLAREGEIKKKLLNDYSSVLELQDRQDIPRIRYISEKSLFALESNLLTAIFYIGAAAAIIIGISINKPVILDLVMAFVSGFFMMFFGMFISGILRKRHGDYIERKLDKGGLLFWIKVDDRANIKSIYRTLRKNSAKNVKVRSL